MAHLSTRLYEKHHKATQHYKDLAERASSEHTYEIWESKIDRMIVAVKIFSGALHLGHALDGVAYGTIKDVEADIAFCDLGGSENPDDEPQWTDPRPPEARTKSARTYLR